MKRNKKSPTSAYPRKTPPSAIKTSTVSAKTGLGLALGTDENLLKILRKFAQHGTFYLCQLLVKCELC